MFDGRNEYDGEIRSEQLQQPLPRELAIAAIALATIMVVMGVALWLVAGGTNMQPGQSSTDASVHVPTSQLLQSLTNDLGDSATDADLEAAVESWLDQRTANRPVLLASAHTG